MKTVSFSELCGFTPKQSEALELVKNHKYVLYGGAMGGGKSYWLRWTLLRLLLGWAAKGYKKVVVGLFCENYPALKDRQIQKVAGEFPEELGTFHADHKEYGKSFILGPKYGSGAIVFRNLDDPSKYQSAEFAAIAIDEVTKNQENVFIDLRTRLRWPKLPDVKFFAATNPGGIGHAWVKAKFLDGIHDDNETEAEEFKYIKALATDNPYLDPGYIKSLSGLPEERRRAFLEGDWDMFKGQYFTEFRREIHVIKPFDIPEHWPRYICGDYGYRAPSAVYWVTLDEDGAAYFYRELYVTEHTPEQLADKICAMTLPNEDITYEVWDPAIWAKKDSPDSVAIRYMNRKKEINGKLPRMIQGMNNRIIGWGIMREFLKPYTKGVDVTANFKIFDNCVDLIRTIPSMVYDDHKTEDLNSNSDDHGVDSARYFLATNPRKAENLAGLRSRAMIDQRRRQNNRNNFYSPYSP